MTKLRYTAKVSVAIAFAAAVFFAPVEAFSAPATVSKPAPVSPATVAMRQHIFDIVWNTVGDGYFDPGMNGVDWKAVRRHYAPRVAAATNDDDFYGILNAMLGELKQSHLEAISPELMHDMEGTSDTKGASGDSGDPGMTVEWVENLPVVVRVTPGGPAEAIGIKPGFVVTAVGGKPVLPVVQKIIASQAHRYAGEERVAVWSLMSHWLQGTVGKPLPVTVTDETGAERKLTLTPRKQPGDMVTFGALPPLSADFEQRTLAGGIGYIRFSIFLMPMSDPVKAAIREFAAKNAPGIIIDLRANPGGIGGMASGIAGVLIDKQTVLGTMRTRIMQLKFPIFPQQPIYTGPVAILTDEGSISTSEIMAGGLQELHRATIVGRTTAGMVLPSAVVTLPDGGRLQYVIGDFRTPRGTLLEGRGVLPDIPVTLTRASLLASPDDPIVAAAMDKLIPKETTSKP